MDGIYGRQQYFKKNCRFNEANMSNIRWNLNDMINSDYIDDGKQQDPDNFK